MNAVVKETMRINKVKQWMVADEIGCSEYTLIRWLRHKLPDDKRQLVLDAIDRIVKRRKEGAADD